MPHYDQIGEGGLDQVLAKRLITPGGSVAPTVAPELFANLTLENDRPEWGFLKSELRFSGIATRGAPVAVGYVGLSNPAGSRVLAVVRRLFARTSAGLLRVVASPTGTLPALSAAAGIPLDTRATAFAGGVFTRRSRLTVGNADAALTAVADQWRSQGLTLELDEPYVIAPGHELTVWSDTVAAGVFASFSWTERLANPGEL